MISDPPVTFRAPIEIKNAAKHVAVMLDCSDLSDALRDLTTDWIVSEMAKKMVERHGFLKTYNYLLVGTNGAID